MSNEPNVKAKSNKSDDTEYGKDVGLEVKGRKYHEKKRLRRRGKVVCVARTEMREFPHEEKQPEGNGVTGRYQEKHGLFTIHFNQAGTYVEAVKAEVFHGDRYSKDETKAWQARQNRPILFLWGREQTDGSFLLVPNPGQVMVHRDGSSKDASLIFNYRLTKLGSKMTIKEWLEPGSESSAEIYELVSNEPDNNFVTPTYMKEVLETLPASMNATRQRQIKMYEHAPLTKQYYQWLVKALTEKTTYWVLGEKRANSLADLIRNYATKAPKGSRVSERIEREKAINDIAVYMNYAVFPTHGASAWHFDDLILASFFAKLILAKNLISVPGSINRTYFAWLEEIVNQNARDGNGEITSIRKHLGITPRSKTDKPLYRYTADFEFVGIQIGVWIFGGGYFEGKVKIKQFENSSGNLGWEKDYHGWMYIGGSNSGVSIHFNPKVSGESNSDWSDRDMLGSFSVLSAESVGNLIEIEGSENFPPLQLENTEDFGRGFSLSGATGTLEPWEKYEPKPPTPPKNNGPYFKWFSSDLVKPETLVHFRCGSARLTDAAIRRIGFMCATELRLFRISTNYLWIYGHADRLDTKEFNLRLSKLRAKNTLTVIRAILGANLRVQDIYYDGFGENEAANDKQPNGVPNKEYRRVDIILGGRLIGRLYGE